jgi:hypothetical protein
MEFVVQAYLSGDERVQIDCFIPEISGCILGVMESKE